MDKNICPFFVFRGKNLAKKSTIFSGKHNRVKQKKIISVTTAMFFTPFWGKEGRANFHALFLL
jgi:hypothetical protein